MAEKVLLASSSTNGFFQSLPTLPPQFTDLNSSQQPTNQYKHKSSTDASDDKVLARILDLYLSRTSHSTVAKHAHHIARLSLDPVMLAHATDAEVNHPVLRPLTTFGEENKNDPLWTAAGWRELKRVGYKEGLVAVAYDPTAETLNRRVHSSVLGYIWSPTGTMTGCPQAMANGAATILGKHLQDADGDQPGRKEVLSEAYRRLTSRDTEIAWTSGQWMTERTGGSDVSGTETTATRLSQQDIEREVSEGRSQDETGSPLGPWKIDGFKWFSSATESEMSVLLARTSKGGLSAFYIPMRRRIGNSSSSVASATEYGPARTELNGVRIQRLKDKLGTKAVPTAEVELKGARGWLIGTEGQGVKEISAILNITRLTTAVGSVSNWARGLAVCRAYSKVRNVRGGVLADNPAHLTWMADETVKFWAGTQFVFLGVAMQGAMEQDWKKMVGGTKAAGMIPKDKTQIRELLRLLLPVMKAQVSVASVHGLRNCMECLGGVGYCENNQDGGILNIAKVYRDNLVNPIWEGTVSVMAEDVVRVLTDKRLGKGDILANVFAPWVRSILTKCSTIFDVEVMILDERLETLLELVKGTAKEELLYRGREMLKHIEAIVSGAVVMFDAWANPDPVARVIAVRYVHSKALTPQKRNEYTDWKETVLWDRRIFLGEVEDGHAQAKL